MTNLYLIRHGAYLYQDSPPYDCGLTPDGIAQAERLKKRLAQKKPALDVLISSPWPRARQTAEIIAPALNLPIIEEQEVEEWRNTGEGGLSGEQLIQEIVALTPSQRPYLTPGPGLESWGQFAVRACLALNRITRQHADKNIGIVCHGGIVEASFCYCFGLSPFGEQVMMNLDPTYTSITHWRWILRIGLWRLESYNDFSHL
jgi:2,3-bisphosphoglycerate-dependent phosphoglycerate mutase